MDDAVVGHDVRGGDFCFVDHNTASGGDLRGWVYKNEYGVTLKVSNQTKHNPNFTHSLVRQNINSFV